MHCDTSIKGDIWVHIHRSEIKLLLVGDIHEKDWNGETDCQTYWERRGSIRDGRDQRAGLTAYVLGNAQ